ncbi:MAG: protein kinase [Deltaproteobacteria bacterium]|nr:protein kinase [Deltaproteobacteria bacterium]
MAEIWLARQRGLAGFNRFVVIKKILNHLSEQETFVKMFLDEARTSAQLNHPNVVQIYDLGRESDSYYIAMEFIAGENLAAIAWRGMKRGRPFPPTYAARVIADGCKALYYAHHLRGSDGQALEIVHRDISPQNILVTYEGEVKVVDFGIAKAASKTEHTKTGMLKGKFSYMSPEQCLGAPVDQRSDIFALGILLYELCTGKRLFKHESELMILEMITKRSVVPPSQVAPGISQRLEDIIMKALEKETAARFQTGQEMQIALEDYLREEAESAANADVAAYMRELFADKIEEKRKLKEIASRDDFESSFADEEATEQAVQNRNGSYVAPGQMRKVVTGLPPSQVQVRPGPGGSGMVLQPTGQMMDPRMTQGSQAGMMMPPGMTPPGMSQYGMQPGMSGQFPYPGASMNGQLPAPESGGWVARLVILGALVVIIVASVILADQILHKPEPLTQPAETVAVAKPPPAVPKQTGSLTLESVPQGATIYLDDKVMELANKESAKTPSDLHSLQFGTKYKIRLEKEGYKPFSQEVEMGAAVNNTTLRPQLEAFPGRLIVEVAGPKKDEVSIRIDKNLAGTGPRLSKDFPGNTNVMVAGDLAGHNCKTEVVRIVPNETKTVTLECSPKPRGGGGGGASGVAQTERPSGGQSERQNLGGISKPSGGSEAADCKSGCCTDNALPPGFVTISTKPESVLYWNGRKIGETPLARYKLPSGCVRIEAKGSDKTRTVQLEVEPNRVRIYQFSLDQ